MDAAAKAEYLDKGFLIVRNIVPQELISELFLVVANTLRKHQPNLYSITDDSSWNDPLFHKAMLQFRQQNPTEFGYMFDTVQTSISLWRLGTERKLCETAAEIMGDSIHGLSITDMLLRMDAPNDRRNKLEWHQDSSYFRQNDLGHNGSVCTISMRDSFIENGPLEILPGSHSLGRIDVPSTGKADSITSEQFEIPFDLTTSFTAEPVLMKAGDALFFNFDLVHRSGFNASEFFRFTAIARFHRMLTDDFKAGRLVYRVRPSLTT